MKSILFILLFLCNSLFAQTNLFNFNKSNFDELRNESGKSVFITEEADSIILNGETINNYFGQSVSTAGDVNGDGFDDIIVGAHGYDSHRGKAYIYFGSPSIDNFADVILTDEVNGLRMGISVSSAGDVNHDGYSDVIVGAYGFDNGGAFTGRAYIYFGGSSMNNIADVILTGEELFSNFGYSVSTAGDVNGDGFDDVIVGAYGYSLNKGRAYLFFGGAIMNNIVDVIFNGAASGDYFGISVSNAGDVNQDNYDDVIIGAHGYNTNYGHSYIYYGGEIMNNDADVTMVGQNSNSQFGLSVSSANDLNKDGFSDVIVGENAYLSYTGKVYVYYGGSIMDSLPDLIKIGEEPNSRFGISATLAGDVNGDESPDLIIGADGYLSSIGRVYIYMNQMPKPELIYPINNSNNNPTSINFKWKKLNSTIYYILNISTDSIFNNIVVLDTIYSDTSKLVGGFQKNKKYFWRVSAMDTSGNIRNSSIWNFMTIPPLYLNLKVLMEGMYFSVFNMMTRKDSVKVYLYNSVSPFFKMDSAIAPIDSLTFTGTYQFYNAPSGNYYIVIKHFNSLETWSKAGGETLINNGTIYNYDFTNSVSQAYGNNMKLKGSKYCIYSGDVDQSGYIDGLDLFRLDNDSYIFRTGLRLPTDLNGDNVVDGADFLIGDNNVYNFIGVITP